MPRSFFSNIQAIIIDHKYLFLFLIVGIISIPVPLYFPLSGIDPSCVIGINLAYLNHLQYGTDIVYTYGVLGFLAWQLVLNYNLWRTSLLFSALTYILFSVSVFFLLKKFSAEWFHYIIFLPLLYVILTLKMPNLWLLLSLSILLYLILDRKEPNETILAGLGGIGFLLALDSHIKFDVFLNSLILIITFCAISLFLKQNSRRSLMLLASYFTSFFLIWAAAGQNFANIPAYLIGGFEIIRGYNEAMTVQGPLWQVFAGIFAILLFCVLLVYFAIRKERDVLIFFCLNIFILFSAFKTGFGRHDGHVVQFFCVYLLFLGIFMVLLTKELVHKDFRKLIIPCLLIGLLTTGFFSYCVYLDNPKIFQQNAVFMSPSYEYSFKLITNEQLFQHRVDIQRENLTEVYNLHTTFLQNIDRQTVDIFPSDIALCWGYGLNWSPRPVFQSQQAYTQYLDDINSRHFTGTGSPEKILFAYKTIDGRYAPFDEPKTFRTILEHYSYSDQSGQFILLNRSVEEIGPREIMTGSASGKMGYPVGIPTSDNLVFGEVNIRYSNFGNLMKIVYKPAPLFIRFQLNNISTTQRYRFVPDTAENGLLLSAYIENGTTLAEIFKGRINHDITGFIIETDHPEQYMNEFPVTFYSLNA
jgi:hypothetical protein